MWLKSCCNAKLDHATLLTSFKSSPLPRGKCSNELAQLPRSVMAVASKCFSLRATAKENKTSHFTYCPPFLLLICWFVCCCCQTSTTFTLEKVYSFIVHVNKFIQTTQDLDSSLGTFFNMCVK